MVNGKEAEDAAATGPARTRAGRVLILDHQQSEANLQRDVRRVVRSTGSDAPAADPNRSMREGTPSTARIAAEMNAATSIGAITVNTETALPAMALIILAIAVAAATEVACAAVEVVATAAVTTAATVATVATCPHRVHCRISTVIRWVPVPITTITIRRWFPSITTVLFLRWRRADREDTMRPHRSRRWQRVEQEAAAAAPFQADSHHVTVAIRTWVMVR